MSTAALDTARRPGEERRVLYRFVALLPSSPQWCQDYGMYHEYPPPPLSPPCFLAHMLCTDMKADLLPNF